MDEFMQAAIAEARAGYAEGGIPIGSVIVHEGRILGRGGGIVLALDQIGLLLGTVTAAGEKQRLGRPATQKEDEKRATEAPHNLGRRHRIKHRAAPWSEIAVI